MTKTKDLLERLEHEKDKTQNEKKYRLEKFKPFEQYGEDYKEKRKLGEGGCGLAYLVQRIRDGKYFVAKKQQKKNDSDFKMAKKELLLLEQLEHPNIVKVEDAFFKDKAAYQEIIIVLEYCRCK